MRFFICSGSVTSQRVLILMTNEQIQFRNSFFNFFHTAQRQAGVVKFHY